MDVKAWIEGRKVVSCIKQLNILISFRDGDDLKVQFTDHVEKGVEGRF